MIGQTISHYKIIEKLGEGGMGVVYKAHDTKLDRLVAMKFLPHHLTANEAEKARFLQEAKAASALNHPNVCTIYDINEENDQQFIVMEFVDGTTIKHKLPIKKLQDALTYAVQIGEALHEAHSKGIVHRDVKAENIMVNSKDQIKVMDFGLAKLKGSLKLTKTSSTIGTLAYMAPEQIQGGDVDARSDLFSFGVVLFEMIAGQMPFRGEHEAAMMYSILNEEPKPIQEYRSDLPSEVLHILNKALEKDPEERYQSVHDIVIDLRRVKKQSTRVMKSAVYQVPPPDEAPAAPRPAIAPSPRKKIVLMLGIAGVLVVAAVLVWKLYGSGDERSGKQPFHSFTPTRISTDAMPLQAAISPDGKYIIYSVDEYGKQSVWMRQVNAASNVRVLPPDSLGYQGFTFSPEGDYVYYSVVSRNDMYGALNIVPTLGGTPRKILSGIQSAVAVSPDGKQLAFLRLYPDEGEEALMICSADGSNVRKLLSRKGEDFFLNGSGAPSWSPDGKTIAVGAGSTIGKLHSSLLLVSVSDGSFRFATTNRWSTIGRIAWVSGSKAVVMVAEEYITGATTQLWYVNTIDGSYYRITSDLTVYNSISLSATSNQSTLLALQGSFNNTLEILPGGDWRRARRITSRNAYQDGLSGLDWMPDGKIVYTSIVSGNSDIWMIDADGKNRRQLTSNPFGEYTPSASINGRFIAYQSSRDTTPHIWAMDADGNNQRKLTTGADDYEPQCSPDNQWIYFDSYRDNGRRNLWKVAVTGGEPMKVAQDYVNSRGVSPDGQFLLVRLFQKAEKKGSNAVLSAETGKLIKTFELPLTSASMRWMPDGKSIAYVDTRNGVSNIWVMPLATLKPSQLTHFDSELIANFAWSKDGKNLVLARGEQTNDIVLLNDTR